MPVSPADFALWARATGNKYPETAEEKIAAAPHAFEYARNLGKSGQNPPTSRVGGTILYQQPESVQNPSPNSLFDAPVTPDNDARKVAGTVSPTLTSQHFVNQEAAEEADRSRQRSLIDTIGKTALAAGTVAAGIALARNPGAQQAIRTAGTTIKENAQDIGSRVSSFLGGFGGGQAVDPDVVRNSGDVTPPNTGQRFQQEQVPTATQEVQIAKGAPVGDPVKETLSTTSASTAVKPVTESEVISTSQTFSPDNASTKAQIIQNVLNNLPISETETEYTPTVVDPRTLRGPEYERTFKYAPAELVSARRAERLGKPNPLLNAPLVDPITGEIRNAAVSVPGAEEVLSSVGQRVESFLGTPDVGKALHQRGLSMGGDPSEPGGVYLQHTDKYGEREIPLSHDVGKQLLAEAGVTPEQAHSYWESKVQGLLSQGLLTSSQTSDTLTPVSGSLGRPNPMRLPYDASNPNQYAGVDTRYFTTRGEPRSVQIPQRQGAALYGVNPLTKAIHVPTTTLTTRTGIGIPLRYEEVPIRLATNLVRPSDPEFVRRPAPLVDIAESAPLRQTQRLPGARDVEAALATLENAGVLPAGPFSSITTQEEYRPAWGAASGIDTQIFTDKEKTQFTAPVREKLGPSAERFGQMSKSLSRVTEPTAEQRSTLAFLKQAAGLYGLTEDPAIINAAGNLAMPLNVQTPSGEVIPTKSFYKPFGVIQAGPSSELSQVEHLENRLLAAEAIHGNVKQVALSQLGLPGKTLKLTGDQYRALPIATQKQLLRSRDELRAAQQNLKNAKQDQYRYSILDTTLRGTKEAPVFSTLPNAIEGDVVGMKIVPENQTLSPLELLSMKRASSVGSKDIGGVGRGESSGRPARLMGNWGRQYAGISPSQIDPRSFESTGENYLGTVPKSRLSPEGLAYSTEAVLTPGVSGSEKEVELASNRLLEAARAKRDLGLATKVGKSIARERQFVPGKEYGAHLTSLSNDALQETLMQAQFAGMDDVANAVTDILTKRQIASTPGMQSEGARRVAAMEQVRRQVMSQPTGRRGA